MTLLALGRDDFTRLLGPLQKLLERQAATYDTPTAKITKVKGGGLGGDDDDGQSAWRAGRGSGNSSCCCCSAAPPGGAQVCSLQICSLHLQ